MAKHKHRTTTRPVTPRSRPKRCAEWSCDTSLLSGTTIWCFMDMYPLTYDFAHIKKYDIPLVATYYRHCRQRSGVIMHVCSPDATLPISHSHQLSRNHRTDRTVEAIE